MIPPDAGDVNVDTSPEAVEAVLALFRHNRATPGRHKTVRLIRALQAKLEEAEAVA